MSSLTHPRERFVLLDAIRGLAAVFVLFRHTGSFWQFGFYRSYLAVDLFFILSGFVIAFAYDEKLRTGAMGLGQFLVVRLIRMYPVYLLSLAVCALVWLDHWDAVALPFAAAVFFLPWPVGRSPGLFGINGPYWSLFFELAANLIYGWIRPWLSNWVLIALLAVSGLGVAAVSLINGNLDTGWLWGGVSIPAGFARSIFGVFLGVFLYRHHETLSRWFGRVLSPWAAFILVGLVLASPNAGDANPWIDTIVVLGVFPVLVVAASRHHGTRGRGFLLILGSASYPLYVLHQQCGQLVQAVTGGLVPATAPWSGVVFTLLLIAVCVGLEKVYDLPVRAWLKRKLLSPGEKTLPS